MTAPISSPTSTTAPSAASSTNATGIPANASMGQDDFLKLLVAQMQNQDPTNPMQAQDLAAQLAQFSSLNQLVNINSSLTAQAASSQGIETAVNLNTAASTLGRTVTATGNQVAVTNGTPPTVTFDVGGNGGSATVTILDANGNQVDSESIGPIGSGRQHITLGSTAAGLASGAYTYNVSVTDSGGNPVAVTTYTVGKVDSLQATASGPVLTSGPLSIPFGSVIGIS
ncbi:MAG TPA: flagellar hook capping FlgD N-terminal domain-containing protein [Gemmatimonadaceae bacterium]|nr:flagellar hook capping FlgD N-terminal domain-containing protein [Gemmatimonadaceae bacterium]